ncbi:MAG: homoserine kinase, partial [Actinomycetota bacterium]
MLVRVPASSANLGPGFDTLGMALSLHAEVGLGEAPEGARSVDEHHPAMVAFRRNGGEGALWVRSPIPVGRGMGFSGAVRVGGAVAAHAQRHGADPELL